MCSQHLTPTDCSGLSLKETPRCGTSSAFFFFFTCHVLSPENLKTWVRTPIRYISPIQSRQTHDTRKVSSEVSLTCFPCPKKLPKTFVSKMLCRVFLSWKEYEKKLILSHLHQSGNWSFHHSAAACVSSSSSSSTGRFAGGKSSFPSGDSAGRGPFPRLRRPS